MRIYYVITAGMLALCMTLSGCGHNKVKAPRNGMEPLLRSIPEAPGESEFNKL